MDILELNAVQRLEQVAFFRTECSLLKSASMSPALQQLACNMNEDMWFMVDGTDKLTCMLGGCRLGAPLAGLVTVFMFGKVLEEVRSVLADTEHGWTLDYDKNQFVM